MKKDEAIIILENLKEKLGPIIVIETTKDEAWRINTASYIKTFFGESSPEYLFIAQFSFLPSYLVDNFESFAFAQANAARKFLENCIGTIKVRGLYKPPKTNFLRTINGNLLLAIITTASTGIFFLGNTIGKHSAEMNIIELKEKIKDLRDSISRISPTLSISNTKTKNDTSANKK